MNMIKRIRTYANYYGTVSANHETQKLAITKLNTALNISKLGHCVYYFIKDDLLYKIGEATNFNGRRGTYTSKGSKCKTTEKIYNFLKENPMFDNAEVYMVQAPTPQISYVDPLFPNEGIKYLNASTKKEIEQKHIQRAYQEGYILETCNEVIK